MSVGQLEKMEIQLLMSDAFDSSFRYINILKLNFIFKQKQRR